MDTEQALEFADALVFAKKGQHLSDLQRLLLRASWSEPRQRYDEIAQAYGYSINYLKQDAGPKLWRLLSDVCGEKVKKTNFRAALERRAQIQDATISASADIQVESEEGETLLRNRDSSQAVSPSNQRQDWGEAPDVSIFYDRAKELSKLEKWIVTDRCRIVVLVGMGGIGKTHLSVKLAENIQEKFEYVIWRSLRHAPSLQQILTGLLQFLAKDQETDLLATVDEKISHLIYYLRKHRCLLVLDNAETILRSGANAGYYKENYKDYGDLLKRLGECRHNSCLLLTSREKPKEIALMQGETLPVRSLKLGGLSTSAGLQLLQLKGCGLQSEEECLVIIEKYAGNPLALKIVGAAIQELFEGNTSEFIQHPALVFDEIYELLEQQFNRLSNLGQTFLYWLAINQEPISATELKSEIFPPISQQKLIETLKSLAQRSFIEKRKTQFSLQPVVMEYLLRRFIEHICLEIEEGDLVLFNSHALLKAQAKEYIRKAQVELIVKPIIERLIAVFKNRRNLENRLRQIISKLKEPSPLESGYAAGNILNLLCQLQTDLTGYDFSHLTVWQAYLQNVNLHNVNFAHADLAKSVFAKQLTSILSVAFSPDGKLLATGDTNGEIQLWQVADSKLLLICKGHAGWVHSVIFSPDGRMLCSGSSDQTVKLWNVSDGKCLKTLLGHNQRVRSVAFSPDGTTLASGSGDCTVRLWDVNSGQCLKIFSGHGSWIWSVTFAPDGQTLASGSEDRTVKIWDVRTGECLQTLLGHSRWVRTVAFSPNGQILASGSGDRTVKLWNVHDGSEAIALKGHTQRLRSVTFSPDGSMLASGAGDHTVKLWDCRTGRCLKTLHGHSSRLTSVAFSPDGTILASGGEDRAVRIWEVSTGQCLKTWQGYASWVQSVAFSPDGTTLASGSEDRTVRLWDVRTDQSLKSKQSAAILQKHTGWVCSVAFSPDGTILASASSDYSLKLWDVRTGMCLKTLLGHTRWIRSLTFSPDGTKLVSGSGDYSVKLWDIRIGSCIKTLQGHTGWIWSVAFSPDGVTVISGSEDKTVKLWDITTGKCLRTFEGHSSWVQSVAFSPDGKTIASGSCDCNVRLWDVSTGECLRTFWGHSSWVQSVAFSPDGKTIASGSCDQTVKLWDVNTGKCWQTLEAHDSWVWSVAFSPDGKTLASSSQDETIKLWNVNSSECLGTLRSKRPYEGMCITDVKGLTEAQLATLKVLGAVEEVD
ncbi:MAG: NB-ARC domain-containing protein [Xenococcaceae cyanobacterium]